MPDAPQRPARRYLPIACLTLAALSGCQDAERTPPAQELVRPAEILTVSAGEYDSGLRFPGRVRAVQRAELTFNVGGKLIEFPVQEGESVPEGALIATLDPASFQSRLAAAQAEFDKARADYERARAIWDKSQAIPRAEVDQKRTAMEVARSNYAAARKDFDDTRLTAPFAGRIARRFVENFQNVQAKEPIVSLQDTRQLEIVIHVPERIVRTAPQRAAGYAEFEGIADRRFPVTLKSYATEADAQTQTYEVILTLPRPDGVTVLPGMSATVFPEASPAATGGAVVSIPLKAVVADDDGAPYVWVVDTQTDRVSRRGIGVGTVRGSDITVVSGLQPGERIVTAGVHHLREGMAVRPLEP